jgi:hypothetical protein
MRILLDEYVPKPLKRQLSNYQVCTVVKMRWAGKKNGELLKLMQNEGFSVLLTADQNLRYQQNLKQVEISIIVMIASSNRLEDLFPLIPNVRNAIDNIVIGEIIEINA